MDANPQLADHVLALRARVQALEAALRNVLAPWDGWVFAADSPISKGRKLIAPSAVNPEGEQ